MNSPSLREKGFLSAFLQSARIKQAAEYISGTKIVDIGGRDGKLSEILKGKQYTVIDIAPETLVKPGLKYIHMSVYDESIVKLGKFDCATLIAVIEHLEFPDKAIGNIGKILKKGGRLIITTPSNTGNRIHTIMSGIGITSKDASEDHQKIFTLPELEGIIEKNGFDVIISRQFFAGLNQIVVAEKN